MFLVRDGIIKCIISRSINRNILLEGGQNIPPYHKVLLRIALNVLA